MSFKKGTENEFHVHAKPILIDKKAQKSLRKITKNMKKKFPEKYHTLTSVPLISKVNSKPPRKLEDDMKIKGTFDIKRTTDKTGKILEKFVKEKGSNFKQSILS